MKKKFRETQDYLFSDFCGMYKKFKVPAFQRAYAWNPRQINDLWESMISNDLGYFIGNIVCLEASKESEDRLVIIDGQQRLITIFLLLLAIRNEFRSISPKSKIEKEELKDYEEHINFHFLFHKEVGDPHKKSLKLLPGKKNLKNIFESLINDQINIDDKNHLGKLDDNQMKYIKNFKAVRRLVKKYSKEDKREKLDDLLGKVKALTFIGIICLSDNDAYDIFEGLNATGIGLSVADLVKNAVLQSAMIDRIREEAEENWEQIERIFEETKVSLFPKFLRHQWISQEGYISQNKLFEAIKETKLEVKNKESIIGYTEKLFNDAKAYSAFRFPAKEDFLKSKISKELIEVIQRFRCLDIEQVYEVILAYYNKFISENGRYTEKQLFSDLDKLWIFSFRAKIISINPSEYEKKFAEHCLEIKKFNKKEMNRMSVGFYNELAKLVKDDESFKENFVTDVKYDIDTSLIGYLLDMILKIDNPKIQIVDPQIEHILPKEPKKWGFAKTNVKDFVDDIGNLTLLNKSDNKSLGNETMKVKVERVYSKSDFSMNRKLSHWQDKFEKDAKEAIRARGTELAEIANKIWRI